MAAVLFKETAKRITQSAILSSSSRGDATLHDLRIQVDTPDRGRT